MESEATLGSQSAALVTAPGATPRPALDGPVEPLNLTSADVKAAVYVGNATTRIAKLERSGARLIAEMKWVLDRFDQTPNATASDTIARIQRKRSYERGADQAVSANAYVKLTPYRALLESTQAIATVDKSQTAWAGRAVEFARAVTANGFGGPTDVLNLESDVDSSAARYQELATRAEVHTLVRSLYDRAQTPGNSELTTAIDELFAPALRARLADSYQKILEVNPDSGSLTLMARYSTGSSGALAMSAADMTRELDTQYQALNDVFDDQFDYLVAARALGTVGDKPSDATLKEMIAKYKELKKQSDEKLEAIKVSLETITKLLKLKDPAAAEKLEAVGNASLGIATAITTFAGSIAAGGVATPIATANLVSKLVLGVASIFKALRKPSKEVQLNVTPLQYLEQLHAEMQARFDRVDLKLDLILDTWNSASARSTGG